MSLLETCVNIINNDNEKIKNLTIPKKYSKINDPNIINKLLAIYYDQHTYISSITTNKKETFLLDKLPIIKSSYIKFFSINGSYHDMIEYKTIGKKYTSYNTGSKYGDRIMKIVSMTNKFIEQNKNIIIDLRDCSGGDINVFFDAFKGLIGIGMLYYFKNKTKTTYVHYNGCQLFYTKNKIEMPRIKPECNKDKEKLKFMKCGGKDTVYNGDCLPNDYKKIIIIVGNKTGSSAEYIASIITTSCKNVQIIGDKTGGYLNVTDKRYFKFNDIQYKMDLTIASNIYNENGKKLQNYILPKHKYSISFIKNYFKGIR